MKHGNIALFIPHNGCPHQCTFCNQREITGQAYQPCADNVRRTLDKALSDLGKACSQSEIAFFGGSFTAIDRDYMLSLLDATVDYIGYFRGIRVSTRPDYINDEILTLLKKYKVTTIELGAQSTDDEVLDLNKRGHTREDIFRASKLIKKYGFDLGLQMMTGLYGADFSSDYKTALDFVALSPDCVRIYPTVVVKNTELASLYLSGVYKPYTLEDSVELCSKLMLLFEENGINVIRVGLHYSDSLVEGELAHNYNPAFRELCESRIMINKILPKLEGIAPGRIVIRVNPGSVSKLIGQKKCNVEKLRAMGYEAIIKKDTSLGKYETELTKDIR